MRTDVVDFTHLGFEVMNRDECQATSGGDLREAVRNKDPLAIAFCCLAPSLAAAVIIVQDAGK